MPKPEPAILRFRLLRLAAAALLLFFLAAPGPATAAGVAWTPAGPNGGTVVALAVHPRSPQIVYAATETNGIFRSTDAGQTWVASRQGMGLGGEAIALFAVKIDPLQPDTVYAVGYQTVWRSRDGGRGWSAILRAPAAPYHFTSLAIDPKNPRRLYLGTSIGVFRSSNAGGSWQRSQAADQLPVNTVTVDPDFGWILAGTEARGLRLSQDGGTHWSTLDRGLPEGAVYRAIEPASQGGKTLLFAATATALFRSDDHGRRWVQVGVRELAGSPQALAFDARTGRLYVGMLGNGVWGSADRGATWRQVSSGLTDLLVLALATGPSAVYAGLLTYSLPDGLFKSTNAGASWQASARGLSTLYVPALAAGPDPAGLLLAGADNNSLLRSPDGGQSWRVIPGLPAPLEVRAVAFDPDAPATVYASAQRTSQSIFYLLRSDDHGETWEPLSAALSFVRLWSEPGASGRLWGAGAGLLRSTDRGATWTAQPLPDSAPLSLSLDDVTGDPLDSRILYAAGRQQISSQPVVDAPRLYRSTDGGQTWQRKDAGLATTRVRRIVVDPADPSTLYAVAFEGLFRSRDRGDSWESLLALPGILPAAFQIAATTPRTLLLATNLPTRGVLASRDEGLSWAPLNDGLGDARTVTDLIADPHDGKKVYAATTNGGIFALELP